MSARIFGDSSSRVVERPPAAARSTSRRFAAAIGRERGVVGETGGEHVEELA